MDVDLAVSPAAARRTDGGRVWVVMGSLMMTLLLEALDQTVVGTAMPRIIATLHGFDRYTWAVTAYVLASTIMLPIAGTLSDLFGRKPFLLGGVAIFLAGSLLCGAAQTINQLIAFRALQGLGAGIGISLVFASVAGVVPEEDRAWWQGILGSVYGISSVIGPALGGWLSGYGPLLRPFVTSSWRWVFLLNLPLGSLSLLLLLLFYPRDTPAGKQKAVISRLDFTGSALIAAATLALLIGLTRVAEGSVTWGSHQTVVTLALAALLFALLLHWERRAREPVLPVTLFRNGLFTANAALTLCLWMALFGMSFYVPLFLQGVMRVSPATAGLVMTPFSLSIVAGNVLAGALIARLRRYQAIAIAGAAGMTAGIALLAQMPSSVALVAVGLFVVIAGAGMGALFTATAVAVQRALLSTQLGAGFGATRYVGQIGGVLGLALVGTVVSVSLTADLHQQLPAAVPRELASYGVRLSGSPDVLVSPSFQQAAAHRVAEQAATRVPPGPQHATRVVATIRKETGLLAQAFAALRRSLALAIRAGLVTALIFSMSALLASLAVRDRT